MNERFYLLKIQLLDIEPAIWRRFVVPASITLDRLHDVIQIVMGWTDSHLHQFVAKGKRYGVPDREFGLDRENEDKTRLDQVLRKAKDKMIYEYDFGDGWEHEVVVEKVLSIVSGRRRYPMVTGGRRGSTRSTRIPSPTSSPAASTILMVPG